MFLDRGGHQIYYDVQGSGKPMLLVHGWMMSSAVWREQIPHFTESRQVITLDLSGYGQSDKPEIPYVPDLWMADIDAVLDHVGVEKVDFVGWSMGGAIGIGYALTRPDRVNKLVLVGSTPMLVAPPEVFAHATPPEAAEGLLGAMQANFSDGARGFVELMIPEPDSEALKDEVHAITQQTTAAVALESIGNAGAADLRPALPGVQAPTCILHGEADMVCQLGAGQMMADTIPGAQIHTFPGKGHMAFVTDAAAFNNALADFLK